jgi:hypothetical protein
VDLMARYAGRMLSLMLRTPEKLPDFSEKRSEK